MKNKIKFLGVLVISLFFMPINTLAEEMSDEFRSYLNEDGKLVVNSVRVESGIEFVFEYLFSMDENGEYLDNGTMISYDKIDAASMPSIDIVKIVEKHKNDSSINPHALKPNYLKLTEAEEKKKENK